MAVPSAFPLAHAVLEVDARDAAVVEAVGVPIVYDEIVEVGIQSLRDPALCDGPSAGSLRDCNAAQGISLTIINQHIAVGGQGRLYDARAGRQWVLPQLLAIGWRNAGRSSCVQQQDLLNSLNRCQLWRAVATGAVRANPSRLTGGGVVSGERAGRSNHDEI